MIQASSENETQIQPKSVKEMTPEEIRARVIELGFEGDEQRFERFCQMLREELPEGTSVALRGSVVTAQRWEDGAPFDAKGKGTSDLDVTLIGEKVMRCWSEDAFYIPELHTKPLGDKEPHLSPTLNPIREKLQALARRPVNVQATNNLVMYARDVLLGQPYFVIVEPNHGTETADV
jgi:hypothetical protein